MVIKLTNYQTWKCIKLSKMKAETIGKGVSMVKDSEFG